MNIVLLEPEIPYNTGAIGRTCGAAGVSLHLIRPLGFSVDEKSIKRAGLDYWRFLDVRYYDDYNDFESQHLSAAKFFATTKAQRSYADVSYPRDCFIIFGKESKGLPEQLLLENRQNCIKVPMLDAARSLNLSVSVGIILYEALRQNNFPNLSKTGSLHELSW